jgi:hypothetical protein
VDAVEQNWIHQLRSSGVNGVAFGRPIKLQVESVEGVTLNPKISCVAASTDSSRLLQFSFIEGSPPMRTPTPSDFIHSKKFFDSL